jgi:hypothetical protein
MNANYERLYYQRQFLGLPYGRAGARVIIGLIGRVNRAFLSAQPSATYV